VLEVVPGSVTLQFAVDGLCLGEGVARSRSVAEQGVGSGHRTESVNRPSSTGYQLNDFPVELNRAKKISACPFGISKVYQDEDPFSQAVALEKPFVGLGMIERSL
jgi:hypothetical protein